MVAASARLSLPVVSLVSPSPTASRLAQELLKDVFSIEPITLTQQKEDELDQTLGFPIFRRSWDSVASKCPHSGTVLHFLSLTSGGSDTKENSATTGHVSLLGITDWNDNNQDDTSVVQETRQLLASHICGENDMSTRNLAKSLRLFLSHATGRTISASNLTGLKGGLPLMRLPMNNNNDDSLRQPGGLKEIAIPFYDDSCYPNGQSLLSVLSSSTLNRPTVGLYQWPGNGVAIRPLPSAKEDRTLPVPSLVFYSEDLDKVAAQVSAIGAASAKIGYNGLPKSGQLMVSHPCLLGLDIRVTDSEEFTSAFPEAQEALLASSLGELQNDNVFVKGGKEDVATRSTVDNRANEGDCWVEFRANMKRPSGFIKRSTVKSGGKARTAKAPDLPFE